MSADVRPCAPTLASEDGTATRLPHVAVVARVRAAGSARLPTAHGEFIVRAYADLHTGAEHLALIAPLRQRADAADGHPVPLVRLHSECRTGDALESTRCDCGAQLRAALARVAEDGGAVIYLGGHEGRGIGLLAKIDAYALQDSGADTVEANVRLGHPAEAREYGAAAAILLDLGMERVRLLTNNPAKVAGLSTHGVEAVDVVGLEVGSTDENRRYLMTKKTVMGHRMPSLEALSASTGTHDNERMSDKGRTA